MFHAIVNLCFPQSRPVFGAEDPEVVPAPTTGGKAARVLDAISGIALVIVGSLVAAGVLSKLSPVAAFAMIGIGAFQLNHFVSKMLDGAAEKMRACCTRQKEDAAPVNTYQTLSD